jgi:hypothetical protein
MAHSSADVTATFTTIGAPLFIERAMVDRTNPDHSAIASAFAGAFTCNKFESFFFDSPRLAASARHEIA